MNRTAGRLSPWRFGAVLMVIALVAAGCGRDDDGDGGGAAPGVSDEPCPEAVDKEKGCIYLGVISDLTGVFKGVGVPVTEGEKAFWKHVNEEGGIGDYEVDVTKYSKDSGYDPDRHAALFGEIKGDILGMAQSLGTAHTNAILSDAESEDILIQPISLGSNWLFEDIATEIGNNYCGEAMNVVDYAVDDLSAKSLASVHFPGDYGDDSAVGAKHAAEERGIKFTDIPAEPGATDKQASAVAGVLKANPDVVLAATGPIELAQIVGGLAQKGFKGKVIGSVPTWNPALLQDKALAPALEALYMQATSFPTWESDTPGHEAMRAAAGEAPPNDWYAIGWAAGYPMKAALEQAIEDDELTREGLVKTAQALTSVDFEGMAPEGSGNYAGDENEAALRITQVNKVDTTVPSGLSVEKDPFTGETLEAYDFSSGACYEQY